MAGALSQPKDYKPIWISGGGFVLGSRLKLSSCHEAQLMPSPWR